jgi:hypothetical protein
LKVNRCFIRQIGYTGGVVLEEEHFLEAKGASKGLYRSQDYQEL